MKPVDIQVSSETQPPPAPVVRKKIDPFGGATPVDTTKNVDGGEDKKKTSQIHLRSEEEEKEKEESVRAGFIIVWFNKWQRRTPGTFDFNFREGSVLCVCGTAFSIPVISTKSIFF